MAPQVGRVRDHCRAYSAGDDKQSDKQEARAKREKDGGPGTEFPGAQRWESARVALDRNSEVQVDVQGSADGWTGSWWLLQTVGRAFNRQLKERLREEYDVRDLD